jgi:hypothetical protein
MSAWLSAANTFLKASSSSQAVYSTQTERTSKICKKNICEQNTCSSMPKYIYEWYTLCTGFAMAITAEAAIGPQS